MEPGASLREMRLSAALALLLTVSGILALPSRAADPALVASIERYLREDEKAILSSLLTRGDYNAQFDGDARAAQKDAHQLKLVLDKWRGRMAAFSSRDQAAPDPDLEGTYRSYPDLLTPAIRAYLARRLRGMRELGRTDPKMQDAFESLRDYLKSVQDALDGNNGKLTWYTKKVVAGIFDKYREDLRDYLGTEFARNGRRDGPAAEQELARLAEAERKAAADRKAELERKAEAERQTEQKRLAEAERREREAAILPPTAPRKPRQPKAPVPPVSSTGTAVGAENAETARRQAENALGDAAGAAERNQRAFDGGVAGGTQGHDPVVVDPGAGTPARSGLVPPAIGGGTPDLAVQPPPPGDESELMDTIKGAKGKGSKSWLEHAPKAAGALLGAGIGFLVGGPVGALVGGILGLLAGWLGGKLLLK